MWEWLIYFAIPAGSKYAMKEIMAAELSMLIGYEEIFGHQSVEAVGQHLTLGSIFTSNSTNPIWFLLIFVVNLWLFLADFVRLAHKHFTAAWSTAKQCNFVDEIAVEVTGHLSALLEMVTNNIEHRTM